MKRLVFILGDGFSINFRRYLGVADQIVTHYLIPPPPHIQFRPRHEGDPPAGPLWTQELFGELWRVWHEEVAPKHGALDAAGLYWEFLRHMTTIPAPVMKGEDGKFTFYTMGSNVELRSYLWHLFTEYDTIVEEALKRRFGEPEDVRLVQDFYYGWEWGQIIQRLNKEFYCTYISFNYDMILERVLSAMGIKIVCPTSNDQLQLPLERDCRLILKPHGSISFFTDFGFYAPKSAPLRDFALYADRDGFATWATQDYRDARPSIFDVVPPGHSGSQHITNPLFDIGRLCADAVAGADAILLCGLSAADPDTQEMDELLSNASKKSLAVHVGREGDSDNEAAKILRRHCGEYVFVPVSRGRKLAIPAALWQLTVDSIEQAPGSGGPRETADRVLVDFVQSVGGEEVMPDGMRRTQSFMLMFLANSSGERVKDGRFVWLIGDGVGGPTVQIPAGWLDLNLDRHSGPFDLEPGGLAGLPLMCAQLPFGEQSKLYLPQDETFPNAVQGNQIVFYPNLVDMRAMLHLVDGRGRVWCSVEFLITILRREDTIRFQFRHAGEEVFSTLVWKVNASAA